MKTSKNSILSSSATANQRSVGFIGRLVLTAAALVCLSLPVSAATLVLTTNAPVPGADDVYNFAGGINDNANVGGGNDQNTYVAADRPTQGQTFTTGSASSGGYLLSDIWIRHCGYTTAPSSGNGTWWNLASGAVLTLRVTDPSEMGQAGFVLASETYTASGTEDNGVRWSNNGVANLLGDDVWLHFTLATPVLLAADTQYGVDLTATTAGGGNFFEWLGNQTNVFTGGSPYTGATAATPGNTVTMVTGARVFLVHLGHTVPAVAPHLTSALRYVPAGDTAVISASIPAVANSDQAATLVLTNNDPSLLSLPGGASTLTLNFAAGDTNAQTFGVQVLAQGQGAISVVTNASFTEASILVGTPISAHESFEYDLNSQLFLDGANGGSGFSAPWSQPSRADAINPGLSYGSDPSLVSSSNAVIVYGTGNEAFRAFSGTYGGVGGGTVWVSFLVQALYGISDWGGASLFSNTNSEGLFMGEVYAQSPNNTWGFSQGASYFMNFANSASPADLRTNLLVYRIDFPKTEGGRALVSMYVDPTLNSMAPYSPVGSAYVDNFTFNTFRLGGNDYMIFDEIRVGSDWTNVVPFVGTPQPLLPPLPTLSVPSRFVPVGHDAAVMVTIPENSPRPVILNVTNDNPTAFSLSSTNPGATTLTFPDGGTNIQVLNVHVVAGGAATLTVVSNATAQGTSLALASQAAAAESFDYPALTNGLFGSLGGTGFDLNGWSGGGSVISPGLTYPGLITSSNAASVDATGTGNGTRGLFLSSGNYGGVGGGTVWVSFLIQGAFPDTAQSADLSLLNDTTGIFFMGLDTGQPNNGKWGFNGPGAGETGFDASVAPSTNTDLLVYRLDFPQTSGGLVNVTFYADPPAGPNPPATPTGTGGSYNFTFNGIQMGTTFTMNFDEIHIGGTWSDVVPVAVAPSLGVQRISASQIQISWPASLTGYQLESSANDTGPWGPAGLSEETQGDLRIATDTIGTGTKFYRLQEQ